MSTNGSGTLSRETAAAGVVRRPISGLGLILAALMTGLISWSAIDRLHRPDQNFFRAEPIGAEMEGRIRADAHDAIAWAYERKLRWDHFWKNSCLSYAIICGSLGVGLGAVAGRAGGSILRGLAVGLLVGVLGGLGAGLAGSKVAIETDSVGALDSRNTVYSPELRAVMIHSAALAVAGLFSGLLVAIAARRTRELVLLVLSGVVGGILATVGYEILGGTVFGMYRTDLPIPDGSMNRLAFIEVLGVVIAIAVWRTAATGPSAKSPAR